MKYPYISTKSNNLLFYAKDTATLIGDEFNFFSHGFKVTVDESGFENNTREYLANTYGVVVSPEHAEFIIKLAKSASFELNTGINEDYPCWFAFDDELYFFDSKAYASDNSRKQITIPLPPKADNQELSEWPQVGDEVEFKPNPSIDKWVKASVEYVGDKFTILKSGNGREFSRRNSKLITRKPKTPEDELRDDIVWLTIKHMENKSYPIENNAYYLFSDLMGKYNITKKV